MGWGGASSPGGGADSSPDAPGGGLGSGAFGGDGPSISGQSKSSQDTSTIEGFRAAIAKAMGATIENNVDREAFDAEMEDAANNRAIAAAVEARDKTARETKEQQERQAMMDQIDAMQNKTNFADPTKAPSQNINDVNPNDLGINQGNIGVDVDDRGLLGAAIDDPQGTQEGLDAEQEARDAIKEGFRGLENKAMGSTVENDVDRQAFENAMKESVEAYRDISGELGHPDFGFSGTAVEGAAPSGLESNVGGPSLGDPGQSIGDRNLANRSKRAALALEHFNNQEQTIKRDPNLTERERARKLKAIQDTKRTTEYGILVGYAFPGQTIAGIKTSTLAKALASLLGLAVPMGIMSVLDKTLGKKGFGQVERDALTSIARDIEESGGSPATAGYGGGSDETKRKFYEYIIQVEPWAKGLSDRQINYYLENEEELEWVRNLYKDMTND
jgi:hypothetical protein